MQRTFQIMIVQSEKNVGRSAPQIEHKIETILLEELSTRGRKPTTFGKGIMAKMVVKDLTGSERRFALMTALPTPFLD